MTDSFIETIGRLQREKRRARTAHKAFSPPGPCKTTRKNKGKTTGRMWPPKEHKVLLETVAKLPEDEFFEWAALADDLEGGEGYSRKEADREAYKRIISKMDETH